MATRTRPPHRAVRKEIWMKVIDPGKIRRWRKQCHFSQRELAFLCRKSQTAIYAVETGKMQTLTEDFAMAIAARLGVPWEELFEAHEVEVVPALTSSQSVTRDKAARPAHSTQAERMSA